MDDKIIQILKEGEKSSTEIASILNRNYYDVLKLLEELESNNKIKRITMGKFTFWRLNNGKEIQNTPS